MSLEIVKQSEVRANVIASSITALINGFNVRKVCEQLNEHGIEFSHELGRETIKQKLLNIYYETN